MKPKVVNRIPGKKAKIPAPEEKIPKTLEETETAGENALKDEKMEDREKQDDKNRMAEARKEFEAGVRGKLKYSRKR